LGYEHISLVHAIGDFSVRGGIVDIFPPGYEAPVRLDFFGDTIESLRTFDPISQRSIQEIDEAVILPASNILFPRVESENFARIQYHFQNEAKRLNWPFDAVDALLDKISNGRRFPGIEFFLPLFYNDKQSIPCPLQYLAANTVVIFSDAIEINRSIELAWERIEANYNESVSSHTPALPPDTVFIPPAEFSEKIGAFTQVQIHDFLGKNESTAKNIQFSSQNHLLLKQKVDLQRKQQGILLPLANMLKEWLARDEQVAMACPRVMPSILKSY
jgi:transcription-repair coupling factor (superfamily II helicase)